MEQRKISAGKIAMVAVIALLIAALTAVSLLYAFSVKQEDMSGQSFTAQAEIDHNDSLMLTETSANNMKLSVARLASTQSVSAEGISLTANVFPETAENKNITWSAAWRNANSSWANGKSVADYVTLSSATSKSGESITVTCDTDFGEQIIIKATAESNNSVFAECVADYCQKIKALNYTFKYDGSQMSAPAAGSDGVYRVDYTGEEKSYTIEAVPVYTDYTVEDEFAREITGKFTSTFGYTAVSDMKSIGIQAGLYVGEVAEGDPTEAAQDFINLVTTASKTGNFNACAAMASSATNMYNALTAAEKAHSRVVNAKQALDYLKAGLSDNRVDVEDLDGATAILNGYVAPVASGDFNGGLKLESEEVLLAAAKKCNDANMGIMDYTITYTGVNSTATFTFKLGYTASSVSAARSMTISQSSVLF